MGLRSWQELYNIYVNEVQAQESTLTDFSEGSIQDIIAGATTTAIHEAMKLLLDEFKKTFFSTANGPEVTGSADDLQTLAVDHFGSGFARPAAQKATGIVQFTRPTAGAGDCIIPAGTVVKTVADANGEAQRFETLAEVTLTGTTINASVRAIVAGTRGNVSSSTITIIESSLTDPTVVVSNSAALAGGAAAQTDAEYRETIKLLIEQLRGATLSAIESKALTVSGIEKATGIEFVETVVQWDAAEEETVGDPFKIGRVKLYVADANGTANAALVALVQAAVELVRAAGPQVEVIGATAVSLNWTASLTLDPGGPNYATLSSDTSMIEDDMESYINALEIGADFDRNAARAYILGRWGSAGSGDLTEFNISSPTGNVAVDENEKLIAGTITIA